MSSKTQTATLPSLKIIAGKYKGRPLEISLLPHTRPTKAIIRESLFNTLGVEILGKSFVEVFSGYGAVGFEALSRGAESVYFIEKDQQTFKILFNNTNTFYEIDSSLKDRIVLYNNCSFSQLKSLLNEQNIDIFYFDPPFGDEYYNKCFDILHNSDLTNKIVIFEHISSFAMPQSISTLKLNKTRKFGKSSLSYYL